MGYLDHMQVAHETGFQRKIKLLMQKAAIAIIGEDSQTAGHTERLAYAKTVLSGEASVLEFSIGVVTNTTVAGKIDTSADYDGDLEFVVNSMFNDFAGYDG